MQLAPAPIPHFDDQDTILRSPQRSKSAQVCYGDCSGGDRQEGKKEAAWRSERHAHHHVKLGSLIANYSLPTSLQCEVEVHSEISEYKHLQECAGGQSCTGTEHRAAFTAARQVAAAAPARPPAARLLRVQYRSHLACCVPRCPAPLPHQSRCATARRAARGLPPAR